MEKSDIETWIEST